MPDGLSFSSPNTGNEFTESTEINPSLGASWTSQFDDSTMATPSAPKAQAPIENISPGQRMISATAGNILTGLLGESAVS